MQIIHYAVRVDFEKCGPMAPKYIEFELINARRPDERLLKSLYLTLKWVQGKDGSEFRKAS